MFCVCKVCCSAWNTGGTVYINLVMQFTDCDSFLKLWTWQTCSPLHWGAQGAQDSVQGDLAHPACTRSPCAGLRMVPCAGLHSIIIPFGSNLFEMTSWAQQKNPTLSESFENDFKKSFSKCRAGLTLRPISCATHPKTLPPPPHNWTLGRLAGRKYKGK